jgi:thiol-disulfide isomerase/thioredoxin
MVVFDAADERVSLDTLRSTVTVVGLWAAYCEPCSSRLEAIAQLAERYVDSDEVAVLLINVDEPSMLEDARSKAAQRAPNMPFYYAGGYSAVAKLLPVREETGHRVISLPLVLVPTQDETIRYTYNSDTSAQAYVDAQIALVEAALEGSLKANEGEPPRSVALKIEGTASGEMSFTVLRVGNGPDEVADVILELSSSDPAPHPGQSPARIKSRSSTARSTVASISSRGAVAGSVGRPSARSRSSTASTASIADCGSTVSWPRRCIRRATLHSFFRAGRKRG